MGVETVNCGFVDNRRVGLKVKLAIRGWIVTPVQLVSRYPYEAHFRLTPFVRGLRSPHGCLFCPIPGGACSRRPSTCCRCSGEHTRRKRFGAERVPGGGPRCAGVVHSDDQPNGSRSAAARCEHAFRCEHAVRRECRLPVGDGQCACPSERHSS
jgi:hypothetical protein